MLVIVGYVRIEKGMFYRHGEKITGVRREKMGKKVEERLAFTQFSLASVITRRRHQRLHPGCWLIGTPSTGTLVQTPFLYLRIPQ